MVQHSGFQSMGWGSHRTVLFCYLVEGPAEDVQYVENKSIVPSSSHVCMAENSLKSVSPEHSAVQRIPPELSLGFFLTTVYFLGLLICSLALTLDLLATRLVFTLDRVITLVSFLLAMLSMISVSQGSHPWRCNMGSCSKNSEDKYAIILRLLRLPADRCRSSQFTGLLFLVLA